MADGSIFSSIMGDIVPFASALENRLSGSASVSGQDPSQKAAAEEQLQIYREGRLLNMMDRNKTQQPYGAQSFQAGKAIPNQPVNSEVINQQWLQRLNRYSSMPVYEGGRAKGA